MRRFFIVLLLIGLFGGLMYWAGKYSSSFLTRREPPMEQGPMEATASTFTPETRAPVEANDIPLLEKINQEYVKVAQAVLPSVVNVFTTKVAQAGSIGDDSFVFPFSPQPGVLPAPHSARHNAPLLRDTSLGSGVIIGREGYIITNGHVVKDAEEINVQLWDNRKFVAKLIGADDPADIAVLKIDAQNLKPLPWGNSNDLRIGEEVLAIGNPFGLSESISNGIVSAKGRNPGFGPNNYEDFIQTNAAINPGNSGGALVNIHGELIGINTAIASTSRGFQGVGFALPSNLARFAVESLIKYGKVVRGYLGVTIQEIKPDLQETFGLSTDSGALITDVAPSSPASKGGLERGEVVVKFNDQTIEEPAQLRLAVSQATIGREVSLTVLHGGKPKVVTLKITELPVEIDSAFAPAPPSGNNIQTGMSENQNPLAGVRVQNVDPSLRKHFNLTLEASGVVITSVEEGSVAEARGLQAGDTIEEIRLKSEALVQKITDTNIYYTIARKIRSNQDVVVLVRHGFTTTFINLPATK